MEAVFNESINEYAEMISVVVPVYNTGAALKRCLDSILKQTYRQIEILIVDDGSSDEITKEICRQYNDFHKNIRLIKQENSGVTAARLNGVKSATGRWIGFVDSDDEIEPQMYEMLIQNAIKFEAEISHCGYKTIVNGGERTHYFYGTGEVYVHNNDEGVNELLSGRMVEPGLWNKLFKKELFDRTDIDNRIDKTIRMNEDLMINFFLFSTADKSVFEDQCMYKYMASAESVTRSAFELYKVTDSIKVWSIIADNVSNQHDDIMRAGFVSKYIGMYGATKGTDNYRDYAHTARQEIKNRKGDWPLLNRNQRIEAMLICYVPALYTIIRKVYNKYFQKKIYE